MSEMSAIMEKLDDIISLIGDLRGSINSEKKENTLQEENKEGVRGNRGSVARVARKVREAPKGFAEWYALYPRKVQRKDAEDAFRQLMKTGVDIASLTEATRMYSCAARAQEPKYVKFPASFLRNERWRDYIAAGVPHSVSKEELASIRANWESGEYSDELVAKIEKKYGVKIR